MGILTGYSEPHEIADAYYARLDEQRERMLMSVTCADCRHYSAVPSQWVKSPCGYCDESGEVVGGDVTVGEFGCDWFELWR